MLTAFNMILSAYTITHTDGYGYLIEENLKYAGAIGLEVKALVCDRSNQSRRALRGCGEYHIEHDGYPHMERANGSKYMVVQMYDYIHILDAFFNKMADLSQLYDTSITRKVAARRATIWQHWKSRSASVSVGASRSLKESVQLFTPAVVAMLKLATTEGLIGSAKEILSYELFAAMTKLDTIFHSGKISRTRKQC